MPTQSGNIRLGDMGITFNRNGLLDVNANKLTQSLSSNFHGIAQFFTGLSDANDGFVSRLQATLSSLTQNRGMVQSRSEGIKNRIKDIDRQIETKERQVARTEESLKEKFSKLEGTIGTLKSKQASVQATLGGGNLMPSLGG
jgi:flagellar hook-associated protein 2